MKKIILFLFVVISIPLKGQINDGINISVNEIIKGFKDFNSLRIVLLEQNFELYEKDSTNKKISETWHFDKLNSFNQHYNNTETLVSFQIYKWFNENGEHIANSITVNFDYYNFEYLRKKLLEEVKLQFPIKNIEKAKLTRGGKTEEIYTLIYSKNGSNITVEIEDFKHIKCFSFDFFQILKSY